MANSVERSQTYTHQSIPQAYRASLVAPLFAPWARILLDFVGVAPGASVLDVASGTGAVAHLAVERVGATGQVTATDISPAMLSIAQAGHTDEVIRYVVCAADALAVSSGSQDIVLCQHGLQFFPDKGAALREMYRVLRTGGTIGVVVWQAEQPLGLFGSMIEAIAPIVPEPFPCAYDARSYAMTAEEVEVALRAAGFQNIQMEQRSVIATWDSMAAAVATVWATPYGPSLAGLSPAQQDVVLRSLATELGGTAPDERVSCRTFAHLARAIV